MDRPLHWPQFLTINAYWWGLSTSTGIITPVLLPSLVALFVLPDVKTSYLATIRVVSLAVAMAVQPMAGLLSDRCTHPSGRRRPFIVGGTLLSFAFLILIGLSPHLSLLPLAPTFAAFASVSAAYIALMAGVVLWQGAANVAQGAMQGLIPDLVPESQRGRAAGFKAVMEVLAVVPVLLVGPLVDAGRVWLTVGVIVVASSSTLAITALGVHEAPLVDRPPGRVGPQLVRPIGLALLFVAITQLAVGIVRLGNAWFAGWGATLSWRVAAIGLLGLVSTLSAVALGSHLGTRVGLGQDARHHADFRWWVTNRLLYLAAVGSLQGFLLYYLADVQRIANPATVTAMLAVALGAFLIPSALISGYLADRIGRKRLVAGAGLAAAMGTLLLILAPGLPVVAVSACIVGAATGTFLATNWALGTELVPPREAGRYLGISNLAGAGAGIIGAGIGGPVADMINTLRPGLGYLVVFGVYAVLFLLSALVLVPVRGSR